MSLFPDFLTLLNNYDYAMDAPTEATNYRHGFSQLALIKDSMDLHPALTPIYLMYVKYWMNNNPTTRAVHLLYLNRSVSEYIEQQSLLTQ